MFRWAVRTAQPRVVYFSSSAAYPLYLQTERDFVLSNSGVRRDLGSPIRRLAEADLTFEPFVGLPDMVYGWSKITGEMLAGYARAEGVKVHVFRPFSGYGDDQDLCYPFPAFVGRAVARA